MVRESDWLGGDEVLIVKVRPENDDDSTADTGNKRMHWLSHFLSAAASRTKGKAGTKSNQTILDINNLQYDLETIPVDLNPDEPEHEQNPETIIGVLILRHVASPSKLNRKGHNRGGQAWIRGWAVSPPFHIH